MDKMGIHDYLLHTHGSNHSTPSIVYTHKHFRIVSKRSFISDLMEDTTSKMMTSASAKINDESMTIKASSCV